MKVKATLITLILMLALLIPAPALMLKAQGAEGIKATNDLTADAAAVSGRCNLHGLWFATDGTNAVTVNIYDNTTATGNTIIPESIISTTSAGQIAVMDFNPPLLMENGVYVDITTAGTVTFKVYYETVYR